MLRLSTLFVLIFLLGCRSVSKHSHLEKPSYQSSEDRISVMTFNVENLFDTVHDPGKKDFTFLPLDQKRKPSHSRLCKKIKRRKWRQECLYLDWSSEVLQKKIKRLAEVILQVGNGRGPDVLILQEIENLRVLRQLNEGLASARYQTQVLIEGTDLRGIDVAVLSRLKKKDPPKLHRVPFSKLSQNQTEDQRGILEVTLILPDGSFLTVFAVHFHAPYHPPELRKFSLNDLTRRAQQISANQLVVAGGDFNIPTEEERKLGLLESAREFWSIPHLENCSGCLGTVYYPPKKEWSFFDLLLVFRGTRSPWRVLSESVRIANWHPEQSDSMGYPQSFHSKSFRGVSDHWPSVLDLEKIKN